MHDLQSIIDVFIHESAVVEPGAHIGAGTSIWHFAHIRCGARIGRDCMLGKDTYVGEAALIGDRVRIQNGVNVYNSVTLEDEVFVGPAVVFTNDLFPRAVNLIDPDLRPTLVRRGASLGAGSIIVCGIEIGEYAMVGAGAVVVADVPAFACVVGNPAHQIAWSCRCGRPLVADDSNPHRFHCLACDRNYQHRTSKLRNGNAANVQKDDTGRLMGSVELEFLDHDFDQ